MVLPLPPLMLSLGRCHLMLSSCTWVLLGKRSVAQACVFELVLARQTKAVLQPPTNATIFSALLTNPIALEARHSPLCRLPRLEYSLTIPMHEDRRPRDQGEMVPATRGEIELGASPRESSNSRFLTQHTPAKSSW